MDGGGQVSARDASEDETIWSGSRVGIIVKVNVPNLETRPEESAQHRKHLDVRGRKRVGFARFTVP